MHVQCMYIAIDLTYPVSLCYISEKTWGLTQLVLSSHLFYMHDSSGLTHFPWTPGNPNDIETETVARYVGWI